MYFFDFYYFYIYYKKQIIMYNKQKIKKTISIDRELLKKIEQLTTNKSNLIEKLLLDFAIENRIKTDDIIL